ncbi:hypothetical protein Psfp_03139 [Pelotomaculum sp. FP]|nr:hypothetical protein Psfp_03139 [Pelotomaculum sp. FP]
MGTVLVVTLSLEKRSKSLWSRGSGDFLRSLRNSTFVQLEHHAHRIYRRPPGSYALFRLCCMPARAKERTQVQVYTAFLTVQS